MITATCTTSECQQNGIGYNIYGEPPRVKCGGCYNDCALTNPQADPIEPDPPVS